MLVKQTNIPQSRYKLPFTFQTFKIREGSSLALNTLTAIHLYFLKILQTYALTFKLHKSIRNCIIKLFRRKSTCIFSIQCGKPLYSAPIKICILNGGCACVLTLPQSLHVYHSTDTSKNDGCHFFAECRACSLQRGPKIKQQFPLCVKSMFRFCKFTLAFQMFLCRLINRLI